METSLTHWPGRVACVLFLGGCTLRCPNCPSPHLIGWNKTSGAIPLEAVLDAIYRRRRWVEGIVLKGGEPLAHSETKGLLELLKDFGLATRVDTTGTRPRALEALLAEELIDHVALELKGPLDDRYLERAGTGADLKAIYESIEILLSGRVSHEFRLAVYESVSGEEDLVRIARTIRGADRFVLRSVPGLGPSRSRLRSLARLAGPFVASCHVDGRTQDGESAGGVPVGERRGA